MFRKSLLQGAHLNPSLNISEHFSSFSKQEAEEARCFHRIRLKQRSNIHINFRAQQDKKLHVFLPFVAHGTGSVTEAAKGKPFSANLVAWSSRGGHDRKLSALPPLYAHEERERKVREEVSGGRVTDPAHVLGAVLPGGPSGVAGQGAVLELRGEELQAAGAGGHALPDHQAGVRPVRPVPLPPHVHGVPVGALLRREGAGVAQAVGERFVGRRQGVNVAPPGASAPPAAAAAPPRPGPAAPGTPSPPGFCGGRTTGGSPGCRSPGAGSPGPRG